VVCVQCVRGLEPLLWLRGHETMCSLGRMPQLGRRHRGVDVCSQTCEQRRISSCACAMVCPCSIVPRLGHRIVCAFGLATVWHQQQTVHAYGGFVGGTRKVARVICGGEPRSIVPLGEQR
jgi:hypothetical protein